MFERKYYPKTTDNKCAPEILLNIIHCKCKTDCSTMHCSCRQNHLRCTYVCGTCQVDGCCNVDIVQSIPDEDSLEDEIHAHSNPIPGGWERWGGGTIP